MFTPEEKVRQQVLTYLIDELKVPEYMIDEETTMSYYKVVSSKRPDILILKKDEKHLVFAKKTKVLLGYARKTLEDLKDILG